MTVADDVAMSVQRSLVHHTATGMINIANAISGRECALVHELVQPAIHHVDGKGRRGVRCGWWVRPAVCLFYQGSSVSLACRTKQVRAKQHRSRTAVL